MIYFDKCINSVLIQTLKNIEIIIIDDASCNKEIIKLKKYIKSDRRIKIIYKNRNYGVAHSRNIGINIAKGEYIFFLDSDDMIANKYVLEELYKKAKFYNMNICGGSLLYIDKNEMLNKRQIKNQIFKYEGINEYAQYQYDGGFYRFIYKKSFLKVNKLYFNENIRLEDCVFFVKVMQKSKYFYAVKKVVYLYRKIEKNKEKKINFIIGKIKARYILIKFAYKYNYKILLNDQLHAIKNDIKKIKLSYFKLYIKDMYFFVLENIFKFFIS